MTEPIIRAENLSKRYRVGNSNVDALKGVNLEIYPGEFVVVYGPSGSGKTTLLSLLAGLEPPSRGSVSVMGQDIYSLKPKKLSKYRAQTIGMVFQQFNLIGSLNSTDNVAMPQLLVGKNGRAARKRSKEILTLVDIGNRAGHKPSQLSGGEQQRVAIARALSNDPEILLVDEPTGNLDLPTGKEIIDTLRLINKRLHRTIILVTHNPDYLQFGDRVFHMADGRISKVTGSPNKTEVKEDQSETSTGKNQTGRLSIWESLKLARTHFISKGVRTFLTTLGVIFGVGTIVALVSLGIGLQQITSNQLASFDMLVTIGVTDNKDSATRLNDDAINRISGLNKVSMVSPSVSVPATISASGISTQTMVFGVKPEAINFEGVVIDNGEKYSVDSGVVLSKAAAKNFDSANPAGLLGQTVSGELVIVPEDSDDMTKSKIAKFSEKVVGISNDESVPAAYISFDKLRALSPSSSISSLKVKVSDRKNVEVVRDEIEKLGFPTTSVVDLIKRVDQVFLITQIILGLIGSVALIVALIGIVNIMTVALLERTHEIGVLKAIGAADADIKRIFIYEVLFFGFIGGLIGVLAAWGFGQGVNQIITYLMKASDIPGSIKLFVTPATFAVEMVILTTFVSILGGWYPSRRAAKLSPMEALRYE